MFGSLGAPELLVILVVVLVIFGPGKLPELGKGLGQAVRGFKKATRETDDAPTPNSATPEKSAKPLRS